jgi:hypothetical protein
LYTAGQRFEPAHRLPVQRGYGPRLRPASARFVERMTLILVSHLNSHIICMWFGAERQGLPYRRNDDAAVDLLTIRHLFSQLRGSP